MIEKRTTVSVTSVLARLISLTAVVFLAPRLSAHAEDERLPLPQATTVRRIDFTGPGLGMGFHGRDRIGEVVEFLVEYENGWKQDATTPQAEFILSLYVGKKKPFVIRAGTLGKTAYLQTALLTNSTGTAGVRGG
jgi:hypothetical protein